MSQPLANKQSDHSSLAAAIDFVLKRNGMDFECCLPAIVMAYDRVNNTAKVKPIIMATSLDSQGGNTIKQSRFMLNSIPVLSLGAGGFHISFPIQAGDLGWIYACDRDIAQFLRSLKEAPAASQIMHKFKSGIFIPDVYRQYSINPEDAGAMVLQSTDGASRISIRADSIKITTPLNVTIDTPDTHITGKLTVDGDVTNNGAVTNQGVTTMNSGFASTGGGSTVNGVEVSGHTHDDAQGGDTGPMK